MIEYVTVLETFFGGLIQWLLTLLFVLFVTGFFTRLLSR